MDQRTSVKGRAVDWSACGQVAVQFVCRLWISVQKMKPIRQQFKKALAWNSRAYSPRDFTLTLVAGLGIFIVCSASGDLVRSPLNMRIAIGCFAVVGMCILLASNRVIVLSSAVMVPAALSWYGAVVTFNQRMLVFCFLDVAFGLLIFVVGTRFKFMGAVISPTQLTDCESLGKKLRLFEWFPFFVFLREHRLFTVFPLNAQVRIVPENGAFQVRKVKLSGFIQNMSAFGKHIETMRKTCRNPCQQPIFTGKPDAVPTSEGSRVPAQIDEYIEHFAAKDTYKFALWLSDLVVQPAQNTAF